MRLRTLTSIVTAVVLVASACITEQRAILVLTIDPPPPDTVFDSEFNVFGLVTRTPPDPLGQFTVTAITTSPNRAPDTTVVQTGSVGNYQVLITIDRDTLGITNDVSLFATDETEDAISQSTGFTVIGLIGFEGGDLKDLVDISLIVDSSVMGEIEDVHHIIGHMLTEAMCQPEETKSRSFELAITNPQRI